MLPEQSNFLYFFMTAKYTISSHLIKLNEFIKDLEKYEKITSKKTFLSDKVIQKFIERTLQQTIEAMLTIGEMITAEQGLKKPEKHDDIFDILAQEGKIYPQKFASELWGLGGFRNLLVHDYIKLDLNKVYNNLIKGIPLFKQYAKYIAKYIKK